MGMEYTATVTYGFFHKVTKESLDTLQAYYKVPPQEDYYEEAPREYLEEELYLLIEKIPGLHLAVYHDEENYVEDVTLVVADAKSTFSFEKHDWRSLPPFHLAEVEVSEDFRVLEKLLSPDKVGWLVYSSVY